MNLEIHWTELDKTLARHVAHYQGAAEAVGSCRDEALLAMDTLKREAGAKIAGLEQELKEAKQKAHELKNEKQGLLQRIDQLGIALADREIKLEAALRNLKERCARNKSSAKAKA